ncbi:MAG TPA: DegT/DnrJ/EryC1/StrS family aminotransferase [Cyclobacteriaceae bacterium]|nr:DegT/DnrJ/EryC1/StrS family aminotransferase [Cyclobacteriaceae bacterium]
MEKIKMVDLQNQYLRIKPEVDAAIQSVVDSFAFIQGPQVKDFGKALATYNGVDHVIPCANGTDALQIALMALDLNPGDEVILPVHTYVATAEVIALLRLKPVFIDVDEKSFNLDVQQLEQKITRKTKAIVPVHLYGQCAEMESILRIATNHNLAVIEDAAQSIGADYIFSDNRKMKAGTMGTIGCTSFFPSKNLGCFGDGGAVLTNDGSLAEKIRMIANHGQKVKYEHDIVGVNSRLDTLQAAILQVKLKYLDDYTSRRRLVAEQYDEHLEKIQQLVIPHRSAYSTHVFNQYTLKVVEGSRDNLKKHLESRGIPTMIYYHIPLHLQKAYRQPEYGDGSFPRAELLSKTVISLPIHTEMTNDQIEYICANLNDYFRAK